MADIQSIHVALGALDQKQRDSFLASALSQQPSESLDSILQKQSLAILPVNSRVRLVFNMEMFPLAHSYRTPNRVQQWVIPQVPDHLKPLVYSTSRFIREFQETLVSLQHGRGDFVKVFSLLNPDNMLEMVKRFQQEMDSFTDQLRDANGRFNRPGFQRRRPQKPEAETGKEDQKPAAAPAEAFADAPAEATDAQVEVQAEDGQESEPKVKRSTARGKVKATPAEPTEPAPEKTPKEEGDSPQEHTAENADAAGTPGESATPAPGAADMAAFGFDVLALAGASETAADPGDDGK